MSPCFGKLGWSLEPGRLQDSYVLAKLNPSHICVYIYIYMYADIMLSRNSWEILHPERDNNVCAKYLGHVWCWTWWMDLIIFKTIFVLDGPQCSGKSAATCYRVLAWLGQPRDRKAVFSPNSQSSSLPVSDWRAISSYYTPRHTNACRCWTFIPEVSFQNQTLHLDIPSSNLDLSVTPVVGCLETGRWPSFPIMGISRNFLGTLPQELIASGGSNFKVMRSFKVKAGLTQP